MRGEGRDVIELGKRREMIGAASVVLPSTASADQDAAVPAGCRLADLHIEPLVVKRDFARDGDAGEVRAQIEAARLEGEGFGEGLEAPASG